MTAKKRKADSGHSFEWLEEQKHALTVPCPPSPHGCGKPAGQLCVDPRDGAALVGPPAHPHRLTTADRARPEHIPSRPAEPAEPAPVRRLVDARTIRGDLASYRQACQYCTGPIVWAENTRGDPLPVDADPHADGHLWLTVDDRGITAGALTAGQAAGAREQGQRLHRPHRDSCPKRRLWSHHTRH